MQHSDAKADIHSLRLAHETRMDADRAATAESGRLSLRTLGKASLSRGPSLRDEIMAGATKQLALVAFLASQNGRSASRKEVVALLWGGPGEPPMSTSDTDGSPGLSVKSPRHPVGRAKRKVDARANDAFRNALDELRDKLGREIFGPPRAEPLRLSADLHVDREAFHLASRLGDDDTATTLYAGPFLPQFELLHAPPAFGHWIERERAVLRRSFVDSAVRLANACNSSTIGKVVSLSEKLIQLEEIDEGAWIAVFQSLARVGATDSYDDISDRLRVLLAAHETEPTAALRALLRSGKARTELHVTPRTRAERSDGGGRRTRPLVGREDDLGNIEHAWESALAGSKSHVHFVSPSGFGKSALLESAREELRLRQEGPALRRTLRLGANQGTSEVPYQFASALAALLAARPGASGVDATHASALVTIAPSLTEYFPSAKRLRGEIATHHDAIASALAELLHVLSSDDALALFLDDLHWSDDASLRVLAAAWQRCPPTRLLMLSASRRARESFCAATGGSIRKLTPLDERDVRAMLEAEAALPREAWARELPGLLHDVSEGSPLQVVEQLRLLASQRLLWHNSTRWRTRDSAALLDALEHPGATLRRIERLTPESRDVLLLLAVAGSPLSEETLLAASGWSQDELSRQLANLSQRGFVTRSGDELHLVHDAHADAVLRLASESAAHRAAAAIGRALFLATSDGGDDRPLYADHLRQLQRAARLLVDGDDRPTLERVFAHATHRARASGDRRPNRALGHELVLPATSEDGAGRAGHRDAAARLLRALETSLPWRLRYFNQLRVGAWALLAFVLVTASAAITARVVAVGTASTPRMTLLASRLASDRKDVWVFEQPIREADLASPGAIPNPLDGERYARLPAANLSDRVQLRSDGLAWVTTRETADSGGLDIFEVAKNGVERRITNSPGDDLSPAWSPDDAHIVFSTSRWNSIEQYDIATYDTLTHEIHQLTTGDDRDVGPQWSPDGSRIAFLREYWAGGRGVCVVDVDGSHLQCAPSSPTPRELLHGWITARELLVERANDTTQFALIRRSVPDWIDRVVDPEFVAQKALQLSPDGRWIACRCMWRSHPSAGWTLFPLDAPASAHAIAVPDSLVEQVSLTWLKDGAPPSSVSRLTVRRGPGDVVIDVPYQLEAEGFSSRGKSVELGAVRWRALDSTARVDSLGVVVATHPGTFRVEVTTGGWTRDTVTLTSDKASDHRLFDERWDRALSPVWVSFGAPRPEIVSDSLFGRAFLNNGDRYYFSGAYSAASFDVRRGLWVEANISTPINRHGQWQEQLLTLFAASDSTWLTAWNHVNGDMTPGDCRVYFPSGDGAHHGDSIFVQGPLPGPRFPAPSWLRTGRPFRALIQVFPDGRCGFAVNDEVLWISPPAFRDSLARVKIDGRSVETRILVGPLRVASGIAPQVQWPWLH